MSGVVSETTNAAELVLQKPAERMNATTQIVIIFRMFSRDLNIFVIQFNCGSMGCQFVMIL